MALNQIKGVAFVGISPNDSARARFYLFVNNQHGRACRDRVTRKFEEIVGALRAQEPALPLTVVDDEHEIRIDCATREEARARCEALRQLAATLEVKVI